MITRLENNEKTRNKLSKLSDIYLIVCWVGYGYLTFKDSGKTRYDKDLKTDVPLVWQYDDFNGTEDSYYLRPITLTTTGAIHTWTYDKDIAENLVDALNLKKRQSAAENENYQDIAKNILQDHKKAFEVLGDNKL